MRILIGTPTYDDRVATGYTLGLVDLALQHGHVHDFRTAFIRGTLVDRARDTLAHMALENECTLFFIDSDISFSHDVARRLIDAAEATSAGVVGIPYPRRIVDSDEIIYSVATIDGPDGDPDEHGLCEVNALPAGFTLIKHEVLVAVAASVVSYQHAGAMQPRMFPYLMTEDKWLYGEDFSFCILAKRAGFSIKALTGCEIQHEGSRTFTGTWSRNSKSVW